MKSLKHLFVVLALTSLTIPAFADNQVIDSLIGAAVGGGGARALCHNCNTRNRNIATAAGALGGAWVGSSVGDSTNRRFNPPPQYQPVSAPGGYAQSVSSYNGYVEPAPARPVEVVRPETHYVHQASSNGGCDEEYYHGEYNPELAHAYCQGRRDRIRQAYNEGLNGR